MIAHGLLTAVCFIVIAAKIKRPLLKKILGYEIALDIGSHTFFLWLGLLSGTFSGLMSAVVAGLAVSGVLRIAKKILGYTKYEDGEWVEHPGTWTVRSVTSWLIATVANGSNGLFNQIKAGVADVKSSPVVQAA